MKVFKEIPLELHDPAWGSPLASAIIDLEKLRIKQLGGSVPPYIFFQLKEIFQICESLSSARIEGNNTTLSEIVEGMIEGSLENEKKKDEKIREVNNIDRAINFIDKNVNKRTDFDRSFISEIHKIIVDGLTPPKKGEGSRYPGQMRPINVAISGSSHVPPDHILVPEYFDELMSFVNKEVNDQYHLLSVAIAHHRMAWIHPFDNGNGRMIRLFTYALLIKQGFQVKSGRILNPSAIFCMDRNKYYAMLALGDSGEKDKMLKWCYYVLNGLRYEIEKIDKLLNLPYMTTSILNPVLAFALEREHITKKEFSILRTIIKSSDMCIKSGDLNKMTESESPVQRSRAIDKLKKKGMLLPIREKGRIYTIGFLNNYLMRGVIYVLWKNKFIPSILNKK